MSEETKETAEKGTSRKCGNCGTTAASGELHGMVFNALEGTPFICERCIARYFGIDAGWNEAVLSTLDQKRV
jgi:hypothetical protein